MTGSESQNSSANPVYARARAAIRRGALGEAEDLVASGLGTCPADSELSWRFLLAKAEICALQSHCAEVLRLLDGPPAGPCVGTDLEIYWWMHRGHAYTILTDYAKASPELDRAYVLACAHGDASVTTEVQIRRGTLFFRMGDFVKAWSIRKHALALAENVGDSHLLALGLAGIGQLHLHQKRYAEAITWSTRALAVAERAGAARTAFKVLSEIGVAHLWQGEAERGLEALKEADARAAAIGDRASRQYCLGDLGNVYHALSDYSTAATYFGQALDLALEFHDLYGARKWATNLARNCTRAGDFSTAAEYRLEASEIERELRCRIDEAAGVVTSPRSSE